MRSEKACLRDTPSPRLPTTPNPYSSRHHSFISSGAFPVNHACKSSPVQPSRVQSSPVEPTRAHSSPVKPEDPPPFAPAVGRRRPAALSPTLYMHACYVCTNVHAYA